MMHVLMAPERAIPWLIAAFIVGYLAGSIPFGPIFARLFGLGDLRDVGSGNIGATNVLRTGNRAAAALTLLFDALKAAVPTAAFLAAWGDLAAQCAALGAFAGHCLPVWLRFRGGKGVAVWVGAALALYWPAALCALGVWLAAARLSRASAVGALAATLAAPFLFYAWGRLEAVLVMAVFAVLIWATHWQNLTRLLRGAEHRF
ncbi:MAG: glycerol-3-phosphate 1-O-acyltransferase PlsY [Pseudomonadota bacterium]